MASIRPNPTLSDDLISQILIRVPVKSLLRFQSVSKTWLSLIKHPAFVKSQLRHATATQTDQTLILTRLPRSGCAQEVNFSVLNVDSREIVADRKFPRSLGSSDPSIIGSANGIVCVASTVYVKCQSRIIYLWNPAIRQCKVIPLSSLSRSGEAFGFGYDPIDHDYKVLRVRVVFVTCFKAEVYSVNKNVWRELPDPSDIPWIGDYFNVCVSGFLCALGTRGMMTFDLNKEVVNCDIKLPVMADGDWALFIEFNNSVAMVILSKGLNDVRTGQRLDDKISIWTLDDDACLSGGGVEALWTPMFSIGLVTPARVIFGYFNNRDLLLLAISDYYKWISCNADKKEAKIVPLSVDMANYIYGPNVFKYAESLVSLAGFTAESGISVRANDCSTSVHYFL